MAGIKKVPSTEEGKKRGRKDKFSEELCMEIVDKFFQQSFVHGQATYEDIADFGRRLIRNDELQARHFARKRNVKERIDKINESIFRGVPQGDIAYIEFNPDKIMDVYCNDRETLMVILRRFADDYRRLNEEFLILQGSEAKYKTQIGELKRKNDKLNEKFKEQKELAEKKTAEVKRLYKFKKLDDEFVMREYLINKTARGILNKDNIEMIMNKIKFTGDVTSTHKDMEAEEYNNVINKEDTYHKENEADEVEISNLDNKRVKKDDEAVRLIAEFDDMVTY